MIDPSQRVRTMPMQVLSLGMVRTGTASMHAALTHLGYETYHGFRAFADLRDYELWNPAYETKFFNKPSPQCPQVDRAFFDKVLGHVSAATDLPVVAFSPELIAAYPEAKIILVQREEDAWYRSFEDVFIKTYESRLVAFIAWLDPTKTGQFFSSLPRGCAQGVFHAEDVAAFRKNARPVYRAHYAEIRRLLKERGEELRLLEYDLGSGWGPLCEFLGRDVPAQPFPKVNETRMMQEKVNVMVMMGVRNIAGRVIAVAPLVVAAIAVIWWAAGA